MARSEDPLMQDDLPEGMSRATMSELPFAMVMTDAQHPDNPIVYINQAFERVTGYGPSASLGRNCRFLQGDDTQEDDRRVLREAIAAGREVTTDIVNYRADGTRFVNRLLVTPLHDDDGAITHFVGIQTVRPHDRTYETRAKRLDESLREVQHRVKNHLSMLLALIRMEARQVPDASRSLNVLANRVESLNLLYDEMARPGAESGDTVALGAYIARVASALNLLDGQRSIVVNTRIERFEASLDAASQIGLLTSELLTNALQHGFEDGQPGEVRVELEHADDDTVRLSVRDNGCGLPAGSNWPREGNLGARIVRDLAGRLDAAIDVDSGGDGTKVALTIPMSALRAA